MYLIEGLMSIRPGWLFGFGIALKFSLAFWKILIRIVAYEEDARLCESMGRIGLSVVGRYISLHFIDFGTLPLISFKSFNHFRRNHD